MKKISKILFISIIFLLISRNNYGQWMSTNFPPRTSARVLAIMGNNIFAGTDGGEGIYLSSLDESNWVPVNNGLTARYVWCLTVSGDSIYASAGNIDFGLGSGGSVYVSADTATNWHALDSGLFNTYISSIVLNGNYVFAAVYGYGSYGIYVSTNRGASWNSANNGLTYRSISSLVAYGNNIYASANNGNIFRSTNNGINWDSVSCVLADSEVLPLVVKEHNIYAGTYNSGVFVSNDSAKSWHKISAGLEHLSTIYIIDENKILAGTLGQGVFLLTRPDTVWQAINEGLPDTAFAHYVYSILTDSKNIYIGTASSGVWKRPLSEVITSVNQIKNNIPDKFELYQNYPNPFNPSTTINYSVSNSGIVTIKIYDILGREVATLVNEEKMPGNYTVNFNGTNLSSGVYFYKMETRSFIQTKKLLLLK